MATCSSCEKMKKQIKTLEEEVAQLKALRDNTKINFNKCSLTNLEIEKYSRQIILPEISVKGQCKLKESSVLVVGTGGLGCPASLYLTAAGVGHIGLVDYDIVDLSNLQRQVLHKEDTVGMSKTQSACQELRRLNIQLKVSQHNIALTSANAIDVIKKYDLILDCTDNVATRYLLNDACVLSKKTLISGSALRFEGQLTIYNYAEGPCYRCLYPNPPPAETVTNCSDGGVIGAVTGIIGCLQALEAIKIITSNTCSYSGKLLLFDGYNGTFRNIKLRYKQESCLVCSSNPKITQLIDYVQFCGAQATDKERSLQILPTFQRISVNEYEEMKQESHVLVDVRPRTEYEICSLINSINIPITDILNRQKIDQVVEEMKKNRPVVIVCKRGNDSQKAVQEILKYVSENSIDINLKQLKDLKGGLTAWSKEINSDFPIY